MNNNLIKIKIQQRLNKLSSFDYDNIECWMIVEAFNKAQLDWCRRQLHGNNPSREGDEQSTRRIDDLQVLLTKTPHPLSLVDRGMYYESNSLPEDYLAWKRLHKTVACLGECERIMTTYLLEESDMNNLLSDEFSKPSFDWAETIVSLVGNTVRIYTNDEFKITSSSLMYYKKPTPIEFLDCFNPNTGNVSTKEVECIFKDDIVELLIDEAASILAGDIEAQYQQQRNSQNVEKNN